MDNEEVVWLSDSPPIQTLPIERSTSLPSRKSNEEIDYENDPGAVAREQFRRWKKKRLRSDREAESEAVREKKIRKGQEREDKKKHTREEKMQRMIEREQSAAMKSKRELYTFCRVGAELVQLYGEELERSLGEVFSYRKVGQQFRIEGMAGKRVDWERKQVEAVRENDLLTRKEYMVLQPISLLVVDAAFIKSLAELNSLQLSLWEKHRCQVIRFDSVEELSLLIARLHRGVANREARRIPKIVLDVRKGNSTDELHDLWLKMISSIVDVGSVAARALLTKLTNPLQAVKWAQEMGEENAERELAGLMTENGRRVGRRVAHKILLLLTSHNGEGALV